MTRRRLLQRAQLYLCTADRPDLAELVDAVCREGVDIVQLRDKQLDARPLLARAEVAAEAARRHGALFVLNDRPDLALACGADGVHVGQDDTPAAVCRAILGPDRIVGLSTHAPAALAAAQSEPVAYLSAGPVEPPPPKPGRPGTGVDLVRYPATPTRLPFFVTGGIAPHNEAPVLEAGASRVVVVRALTEASDPAGVARRMRALLDAAGLPQGS